ncbi:MAG TPA: hypothetical protein VF177_06010 [Anaerolineae bacterium]
MKTRILHLGIAVIVALVALMFFGTFVSLAAPVGPASPGTAAPLAAGKAELDIRARRITSIPFGIDSPLNLSPGGRLVEVTGHAECQEGGETFKLRVTVTQESTRALAKGRTSDDCDADTWAVDAEAVRPSSFVPGDVEVCAMAIVFFPRDGAIVQKWCANVELQ